MNPQLQLWMPAVLSLFGALIVVVLTAWLNTKMLSAQVESMRAELRAEIGGLRTEIGAVRGELRTEIGALRAEMKQGFAELRLEFHQQLTELSQRVERLEEARGLVRP
jgi:Skp family chaperone for outer membrane proteins